jgi:GNAT superfamily N-acetyltransferase
MTNGSMISTPSLSVRRATAADVGNLSGVLAAAFADDPVFGWLLPDPRRRMERLARYFELELAHVALRAGCVWTSADGRGVALAMPPGAWRLPPSVAVRQAPAYGRVFGRRLPKATLLLGLMEHRHIRQPHWYFPYIGVAPEAQGGGVGTSLMLPTLERCDDERCPAYLEASNERCARLYERLGFRAIDELRVLGSPPLRLMLREPA